MCAVPAVHSVIRHRVNDGSVVVVVPKIKQQKGTSTVDCNPHMGTSKSLRICMGRGMTARSDIYLSVGANALCISDEGSLLLRLQFPPASKANGHE